MEIASDFLIINRQFRDEAGAPIFSNDEIVGIFFYSDEGGTMCQWR
jgi:hypothetical protein